MKVAVGGISVSLAVILLVPDASVWRHGAICGLLILAMCMVAIDFDGFRR